MKQRTCKRKEVVLLFSIGKYFFSQPPVKYELPPTFRDCCKSDVIIYRPGTLFEWAWDLLCEEYYDD